MFPKLLFNVCNAGMFMALGLVLYKLAVGRRSQKADWLVLALIYAALWEISPVFGQTNLWMCGACNYLWATVGCCAFCCPGGIICSSRLPVRRAWRPAWR